MTHVMINFPCESMILTAESSVTYHIMTDRRRGNYEFSIKIDDITNFLNILLSLLSPVIEEEISIAPDRREYEMWLQLQILKKVNAKTGTSKTKDRSEFEDLATIMKRRDDTETRIRGQLNYIHKMKSLIPKAKARMNAIWREISFPSIVVQDGSIALHTYGSNIYTELSIKADVQGYYSGFIDLSMPFFESIDHFSNKDLIITNKLPITRQVSKVQRRVEYSDVIRTGYKAQMLLYLSETMGIGDRFVLNRIEFFDLLSNIRNYAGDTMLEFEITAGKGVVPNIRSYRGKVDLYYTRNKTYHLKFKVPASFFNSLLPTISKITSIELNSNYLGNILHVAFEEYSLTKVYIPDHTKYLFDYIHVTSKFKSPGTDKMYENIQRGDFDKSDSKRILQLLYKGKVYFNNHNKLLVPFALLDHDDSSWIEKIDGVEKRNLVLPFVERKKSEYSLHMEHHRSIGTINNTIEINCSCGRDCIYRNALLSIILEDLNYAG